MAIQINTAAVSTAVDQIDMLNKKIRDDLTSVDSAIQNLKQCWEGKAATEGIGTYEYIKNGFSETRFSVVNGMVVFMRQQVGQEYDDTEYALISAASMFK